MTLTTAELQPRERKLAVDTASASEMPFLFELESETLRCTNGGGTLFWDVDRHVNGTRASLHALGATVTEVTPVTVDAAIGASSATAPVDLPANANGIGLWASAKATGDHRTIYARLYAAAAGASGEAVRAFATVITGITAAVGGTLNGLHATLSVAGTGKISGAGQAIRATLGMDASADPGGTLAVIRADTDLGTSAVIPARTAFLATDNLGTPKLDYLLNVTNPSTTMVANAGTGGSSAGVSTGGVAAKVVKVSVAGVDYWLPLFSSNG